MIGRCTRAVDFQAALGAVLNKPGAEVLFDNNMCGIHDVLGATNLMLTGASASRTNKPVYHLSVRWDKHDGATRAQMEETAQRLLGKLKLQEHQALCVRHTDAEHPHIHVIVNRVHPDHGTMGPDGKKIYVWSGWGDYERVERELRKLEVEHSWRQVPGRHAIHAGHEVPTKERYWDQGRGRVKDPKIPPPAPVQRVSVPASQGEVPAELPQRARAMFGVWKAAEKGNAECQWQIGKLFQMGAGVRKNLPSAVGWFKRAAAQGFKRAEEELGDLDKVGLDLGSMAKALTREEYRRETLNFAAPTRVGEEVKGRNTFSIAAISDTHGIAPLPALLDGCKSDVLIHCGDFTGGKTDRVYRDSCYVSHIRSWNWFCEELEEVRAQFGEIVVVPGNHDQICEAFPEECVSGGAAGNCRGVADIGVHLLMNSGVSLNLPGHDRAVRFWGMPHTPPFANWFFQGHDMSAYTSMIPANTDVLICHGPPNAVLDTVDTRPDEHLGCRRLRDRCQEIPTLKGVFFGHIHSSHGHARMQGVDYFNCSILNEAYNVAYGPIMTTITTT